MRIAMKDNRVYDLLFTCRVDPCLAALARWMREHTMVRNCNTENKRKTTVAILGRELDAVDNS